VVIVQTVVMAAVGAVLIVSAPHHPIDQNDLIGTCSGHEQADPTRACYSPEMGAAQAVRDAQALALRIHVVEAGRTCWAPGTRPTVPATAVMRSPAGVVALVPFALAWSQAHHGYWTEAVCA
jgi:hypothetical protein